MPSPVISGAALPLARANVDTDLIIPARFMKTVTRKGLGEGAFEALRSEPGNPFDDPRYRGAPILVVGANFGCGSSREHAVWALQQIGVKAVIAPSFGEIFENNALRNGLVAVRLSDAAVERLLALGPGEQVTVDILDQVVIAPGGQRFPFPLDPFRKQCLVHGIDEIDATMELEPEIAAFEEQARRRRPWLVPATPEELNA